jgi:ribonuclease BN (tRNA processing enzyme)
MAINLLRSLAVGALAAGLAVLPTRPAQAGETCPPLRWTTLGTAGGPVPTPERSEPANLLVAGDQQILVDTGDGTVTQLARAGLELGGIQTVFISHHHMDHTGGLAAVIGLRWMNTFPGVLTVYGPAGTREMVDGIIKTMQPQARIGFGLGTATPDPAASVRVVELDGGAMVRLGDLTVSTAANSHFDHPGKVEAGAPVSLSYRFQLGGRSITYTGDTGPSAAVGNLAAKTDMLVSEVIDLEPIVAAIRTRRPDMPTATFNQMREHLSTHHLTARDLGQMARNAQVGHLVLTHFAIPPWPLRQSEPALRQGIAESYSGPVDLARDLSSFDIGCR